MDLYAEARTVHCLLCGREWWLSANPLAAFMCGCGAIYEINGPKNGEVEVKLKIKQGSVKRWVPVLKEE
jgi:hypothetical protein